MQKSGGDLFKSDAALRKLLSLIDEMELSEYSYDLIDRDHESKSNKSNSSVASEISQRDVLISSLRHQIAELKRKIGYSFDYKCSGDNVDILKSAYEGLLNEKTSETLRIVNETDKKYKQEIDRLYKINEDKREELAFHKLPDITEAEYNDIIMSPMSSVTIKQFLAAELYRFKKDLDIETRDTKLALFKKTKELEEFKEKYELLESQYKAESNVRETLENQLLKLSRKAPPIPEPQIGKDLPDQIEKSKNELSILSSHYYTLQAKNDLLLKSLHKANASVEKMNSQVLSLMEENESLKLQLSHAKLNIEQQDELLQRRDDEIKELKIKHFQLLRKSLEAVSYTNLNIVNETNEHSTNKNIDTNIEVTKTQE